MAGTSCPFFPASFFISIRIGKPGISFSEMGVCHLGINLLLVQHLHVLTAVKATVSRQLCLVKDVIVFGDGLKITINRLNARILSMFMAFSTGSTLRLICRAYTFPRNAAELFALRLNGCSFSFNFIFNSLFSVFNFSFSS